VLGNSSWKTLVNAALLAAALGMACGAPGLAQTRPVFGKPSNSMGTSSPYADACISRTCSFMSDPVPGGFSNYQECDYAGNATVGKACVCRYKGRFRPGQVKVVNSCAPAPVVR